MVRTAKDVAKYWLSTACHQLPRWWQIAKRRFFRQALARGITVEPHPADWKRHGRAAGPIRNQKMLEEKPEMVVAFPGGKGTADMVKKAGQAGIEVFVVEVG